MNLDATSQPLRRPCFTKLDVFERVFKYTDSGHECKASVKFQVIGKMNGTFKSWVELVFSILRIWVWPRKQMGAVLVELVEVGFG